MPRAGREPAEDVKHRLVAACEEVGLTVASATICLVPEAGVRVIHFGASVAGWPYDTSTLAIMATVPVTGQWPDFVDIRCSATPGDPVQTLGPWMQGRGQVPFPELVEQLRATLAEPAQVIAAAEKGIPGPYRFERSVWERVDLLPGGALPRSSPR